MKRYYLRVRTEEQLDMALQWGRASGLLLDYELAEHFQASRRQRTVLKEKTVPKERTVPKEIFYCLPDVMRQSRIHLTEQLIADSFPETGLLVRNLDELGLLQEIGLARGSDAFPTLLTES